MYISMHAVENFTTAIVITGDVMGTALMAELVKEQLQGTLTFTAETSAKILAVKRWVRQIGPAASLEIERVVRKTLDTDVEDKIFYTAVDKIVL